MIDLQAPREPLTVHLPAELIREIEILAREKHLSIDEVVLEACQGYLEPYVWERDYKEWLHLRPDQGQDE